MFGAVGRDLPRRRAVDATIPRLPVIPTDRQIAQRAGLFLVEHGLSPETALDAFVVANAADHRPAVILTGDPSDIGSIAPVCPTSSFRPSGTEDLGGWCESDGAGGVGVAKASHGVSRFGREAGGVGGVVVDVEGPGLFPGR